MGGGKIKKSYFTKSAHRNGSERSWNCVFAYPNREPFFSEELVPPLKNFSKTLDVSRRISFRISFKS